MQVRNDAGTKLAGIGIRAYPIAFGVKTLAAAQARPDVRENLHGQGQIGQPLVVNRVSWLPASGLRA
jgi:hypothetical protein